MYNKFLGSVKRSMEISIEHFSSGIAKEFSFEVSSSFNDTSEGFEN